MGGACSKSDRGGTGDDIEYDLGSQILWCATERVCEVVIALLHLRQSKICYLYVALVIEKHVLRFEVAIDYTLGMQMLQG